MFCAGNFTSLLKQSFYYHKKSFLFLQEVYVSQILEDVSCFAYVGWPVTSYLHVVAGETKTPGLLSGIYEY